MPKVKFIGDVREAFAVEIEISEDLMERYETSGEDSEAHQEMMEKIADEIGGNLKLGREHMIEVGEYIRLDDEGNEIETPAVQLHIHYKHENCPQVSFRLGATWTDVWSSAVDADCPSCGMRHISPVSWHRVGTPCPSEAEAPF